MIFFDASAAAKRYFHETGSDQVDELWSGGEFFSSLVILHCELTSALNRKRREGAHSKANQRKPGKRLSRGWWESSRGAGR